MRLREYITKLEAAGELQRITTKVDTRFEITEITDRISKSEGGGKALLFENTGTDYPVLMNMMGSDKRMAMALGVNDLSDISKRIDNLLKEVMTPKNTLMDKLRMLPYSTTWLSGFHVRAAAVESVRRWYGAVRR